MNMSGRVFKKNFFVSLISGMGSIIFTVAIVIIIFFSLRQTEYSSRAEGVRILEESIMRVAIHSFAVEGHFPESIAYIEENYNIFIDRTRFVVHYDVFAANLLPDIRVFELHR
ncbi:MAG: hypothetical protein FWE05_04600 [Defluviitaleaceae bacterium]|nr:hypothetical protein [Defluviitaleaceae bacterium]